MATEEVSANRSPAAQSRLTHLKHAVEHAAHILPSQGPITVFVHHNTLHSLEEHTFEDAVALGARTFGCEPYLTEQRYNEFLASGRISVADLQSVLSDELGSAGGEEIARLCTRFALRLAMLQYPLMQGPEAELRWVVAETDALKRFRSDVPDLSRQQVIDETRHWAMRDLRNFNGDSSDPAKLRIHETLHDLFTRFGEAAIENWSQNTWQEFCLQSLWRVCRQGVHGVDRPPASPAVHVRPRDYLWELTGQDPDLKVNETLIRFCAPFLDQGFAHWSLPDRAKGFYEAFVELYESAHLAPDPWVRSISAEFKRLQQLGLTPLEVVEDSLAQLGVLEAEWESFISSTLLALRGWAGMIWQMETRTDRVAQPAPVGSLLEFLAVRLVLDRLAAEQLAGRLFNYRGMLSDLRAYLTAKLPKRENASDAQRAFAIFQIAQVQGWRPQQLFRLSKEQWRQLVHEVEAFSSLQRRRVLHAAYERRYYTPALDALESHAGRRKVPRGTPQFQVICCIDDREESFRRHLEEINPAVETFGAAGFFSVVMYYRGAADAQYIPLCPIVVRPQHWVKEDVVYSLQESHARRTKTRRVLGTASHEVHVRSRTFLGGALLAAFGPLASIPMIARVLFPRLTARLRKAAGTLVSPPAVTQLSLERHCETPGPEPDHHGFTVKEMANNVERLLRDMGLTSNFARLIVLFGHGSSSLNNPHESAYNCGACAGSRGGPNARAFAQMANDPRVRTQLAERGLVLPAEVYFVGGFHNTCDEGITYFDLDRLPASHRTDFDRAREVIDKARQRNAHERCRRFGTAPLTISPEAALRHVEARAEDLAQTRPEYNHATNAMCIVGRRETTRGLFLDRRAFLTSYDPAQDDEQHSILTRILQAVVPVCAGISLEYYFSSVDPVGWGCGSKLPHNVTSLLGVMEGAASDLRTGLSAQMVEIHEPVRILFVVETTPTAIEQIMQRNPGIDQMIRNGWVRVATLDPQSGEVHVFRHGNFERYHHENSRITTVKSSIEWYRGWRDHLSIARIAPSDGPSTNGKGAH